MSLYAKTIARDSFDYQFYKSLGFPPISDAGMSDLVLRITLDDMGLIDGFYMPLPADAEFFSIEAVIEKYVICESSERSLYKEYLSQYPNPDLPDILDALREIYDQQKAGKVSIKYHINNGESNVQSSDPIYLHQQIHVTDDRVRIYKLLDVVMEVCSKVDPFYMVTEKQKASMLDDFRQVFMLYIKDKFGYFPELNDIQPEIAEQISDTLIKLSSDEYGMIQSTDGNSFCPDKWEITNKGYDLLDNIINEAEFYIDNYDIFGDVHVKGFVDIMFNTGYGDNLIVPVLLREGIDPYRAIFLTAVYFGNLDELLSDIGRLFSEELFRQLFSLIARRNEEDFGFELLSRIIIAGKTKVLERNLRDERLKAIESINKRMNLL
jgi:hypothetical protein